MAVNKTTRKGHKVSDKRTSQKLIVQVRYNGEWADVLESNDPLPVALDMVRVLQGDGDTVRLVRRRVTIEDLDAVLEERVGQVGKCQTPLYQQE